MTRTSAARRSTVGLVAVALGLTAAAGSAPAAPQLVQAVVSYDGPAVVVPGVQLVTELRGASAAVVRGTAASLRSLALQPGVRGVAPDGPVSFSSTRPSGAGVLAPDTLGEAAGRPQAGRGVRVAVVDTGVSDSAALSRSSGRLVDGVDTSGVFEGGRPVTAGTFADAYGHGTFMASLVAGGPVEGSRGRAVGVAPGATVVVVKVADAQGTTSLSEVVAGLSWIAEHPEAVDVANLSFSHVRPGTGYGADPLTDAVEAVRDSGTTVVVSAGNDPTRVGDPGFDPRVLTVGAADVRRGEVAGFSGSDDVAGVAKPDVVAAGVGVLGVLPPGSVIATEHRSSHAGGDLWRGSGTSQATAVTSGAAALLLGRHPSATPAQVKASLRTAARDLADTPRDGEGLLQVTSRVASGPDGTAPGGSGEDLTGEAGFDASSWSASSWSASSWSASSWSASSWSASSWSWAAP